MFNAHVVASMVEFMVGMFLAWDDPTHCDYLWERLELLQKAASPAELASAQRQYDEMVKHLE